MKGSKLKIILSIIIILLVLVGGTVTYIISTKIKPEEIRKIAITELEKVFPNAKIELGKIDFGIGSSITLNAEKFIISYPLKSKEIEIFNVNTISARIPIFTILMGGGTVDINIDKPFIRHLEYGKSNLWQLAMKKQGKSSSSTNSKEKASPKEDVSKGALAIPLFVANSSVNLSFLDIKLEYGKVGKLAGKIDINKFVIKNLGLRKHAAYEVNSKIMLSEEKNQNISLNTLLIGEFSLKNFLDKGIIKSKAILTLSNIVIPNLKGSFPEFKNDIDLNIDKSGDIALKLSGEFEKSNYKFDLKMNKKGINVNDILFNLYLMDLKTMLPEQMGMVNPGKSNLKLDGNVRMITDKIYPNLNYSLSNYINITLPDYSLSMISSGRITEQKLYTNNNTKVFGGSVDANLVANFNLNSKSTDIQEKLKSYSLNLDLANLNFDKAYLQKTLYSKKVKDSEASSKNESLAKNSNGSPVKGVKPESSVPMMPRGTISIKAKGINLGGKNLNVNGKVITKGNAVTINSLKFMLEQGQATLNSNISMYKNSMKTKFNLGLKNINISSFDGLMPQQYSGTHGLFSGKVSGTASTGNKVKYNANVNINASNGELKGIDLKPYLEKVYKLAKKIPGLNKKVDPNKKVEYTGNFKKFSLTGVFKPNHYRLKSTEFIGLDNLIEAKANGNIYPETKKVGKVFADIIENKYLSNYVESYAGTRTVPVLFKGPGMTLNADYQYTIKKLSKNVLKKNKSKIKKKAKTKLKKEVDKIFKGKGKEKIDKLLKGLF